MMNTLEPAKSINRLRLAVRIMHIALLVLTLVIVLILALLPGFGFVPVLTSGDPLLAISEAILGGVSLLVLCLGFFWPRLVGWHKKAYVDDREIFYGHLIRSAVFFSVAMYSLILHILGSGWYIVVPLFILAFAALVSIFPSNKRWTKWQGQTGQKESASLSSRQ
jgi:hypothetical protein